MAGGMARLGRNSPRADRKRQPSRQTSGREVFHKFTRAFAHGRQRSGARMDRALGPARICPIVRGPEFPLHHIHSSNGSRFIALAAGRTGQSRAILQGPNIEIVFTTHAAKRCWDNVRQHAVVLSGLCRTATLSSRKLADGSPGPSRPGTPTETQDWNGQAPGSTSIIMAKFNRRISHVSCPRPMRSSGGPYRIDNGMGSGFYHIP